MSWLKSFFGSSEDTGTAVAEPATDSRSVEEVVAGLRRQAPEKAYCYIVLFGDRPLTGKMGAGDSIMIFSTRGKADDFVRGYQQYYRTTKPLSVLPLGSISDLWAMLNNTSSDPLYKPPYGLIINFSYSGGAYNSYEINQLSSMGPMGLKKGLGQLF